MSRVSAMRLTAPKPVNGAIVRQRLIDSVLQSGKHFVYIHAGAGYGKTTLLSQIAGKSENTVWLSLDGENDVLAFVNGLCAAIQCTLPGYAFASSEYLPFMESGNFITMLANAVLCSLEELSGNLTLILDDFHTAEDVRIKELMSCFMKYAPENIKVYFGSREAVPREFVPLYLKGEIFELSEKGLAFTKEEIFRVLGIETDELYRITEGWPLAVGSFKVLLENGVSPADVPLAGKDTLYSYLFYECISRLSPEIVDFLKASACFEELDAAMLDAVLHKKNTRLLLESLVSRSIFTVKTGSGHYRYHALFRNGLMEAGDASRHLSLQREAAKYYYDNGEYSRAAEYAIKTSDKGMLQKVILASYKTLMKTGNYSELRLWFQALGDISDSCPEILAAKGAFLSSIGNFVGAKACLDAAIPRLEPENTALYMEAMVHKARVFRNYDSFEKSNVLLNELIPKLDGFASETAYSVVIEKLYNLCWDSREHEAMALGLEAVENCVRAGNLKIKAWYERYMSAVCFFYGDMRQSVSYYEKAQTLSEEEQQYLDLHSIGIYAAKAYQMLGDRDKAVSVITDELQNLRTTGKYEEMWSGYLFAAEIYYQNAYIDKMNGKDASYEKTIRYFSLADEYAQLFRKSDFQRRWADILRLPYSLFFSSGPKSEIKQDIFTGLDTVGDLFKVITLARLFGYYAAASDYPNAVKCAKTVIEVGERAGLYLYVALAYGMLARAAIAEGQKENAVLYTGRCLELCHKNGIYEYFKVRKDYDPVLEFAYRNEIHPDITKELMEFAGFRPRKAYVKTFGDFSVFPYDSREKPLKMRTKKERELLAFLLNSGARGVTKDEIIEAVWPESESKDVKKLIGVNLAQIKKDLASLGLENAVVCREKRYSIRMDEIECDFKLFDDTAEQFHCSGSSESGRKLLNLYAGEYLADFEALWSTAKRIQYRKAYDDTVRHKP